MKQLEFKFMDGAVEKTILMDTIVVDEGDYQTPSKWVCVLHFDGRSANFDYTQGSWERVWDFRNNLHARRLTPYPKGVQNACMVNIHNPRTQYEFELVKFTKPTQPETESVIECLLLDSNVINFSFEDWAKTVGFDPDSRKAERVYFACRENSDKFRGLLGSSYDALDEFFQ